jgi:hypothetical protein
MSNPSDQSELSSDAEALLAAAHEVNLDFDEENTALLIAFLRTRADSMDANRAEVLKAIEREHDLFMSPSSIFMNGYAYAAVELRELATELEAHS